MPRPPGPATSDGRRTTPLLVLLAIALCACGGSGGTSEPATIAVSERTWVDTGRATPSNATFPGAATRTLRTVVWLPPAPRHLPLLVLAHGFGGRPEGFEPFARAVAAAGYVVAAPAFPLTNAEAPGGHETALGDYVNEPADLSFVIDRLLEAAATAGDPLGGRLAADDVAVLGHSLGGAVVLGLTRKACCRDARVRASIVAGAPWRLAAGFGRDPLAATGPPTLIVHGTADRTAPFANAEELYALIAPPRFLLGLDGAGHGEAFQDPTEPPIRARDAAQRAVVAFLDAVFDGATDELDEVLTALSAEGHVVESEGW